MVEPNQVDHVDDAFGGADDGLTQTAQARTRP